FSGAQLGTADYPYWTLGQGTSAVQTNHTVHIYAGHTSETPTISKPMVLRSVGGTAFIGK
ncbi:MAG: hypothetical protein NT154_48380, partial [Verrucomicrobia bacterium]|nr:hypothetical protein [Verrucomicrobiota bacterium]